MTIGQKIKTARLAHGLTQEELASKVGVQKSAIAKWETGRVQNIMRSNLKTLADTLELDPAELVGCEPATKQEINPLITEIIAKLAKATPEQLSTIKSYIYFVIKD